jgi:hypothetical protein
VFDQVQQLLSERFVEFLGLVLTLLSGWAINQLRVWLKTRANIELTEAQEKRLRELAAEAIDVAEEWAHRQHKEGRTIATEEKLDVAKSHMRKHVGKKALGAEIENGEAEDRIHSELGRRRSVAPPAAGD